MSRPSRRRAACTALVLVAASLVVGLVSAATPASDAGSRLNAFFAAEWERGLRESPESASFDGDLRFNDRWSDNSLKAIAESEAEDRAALKTLQGFDRAALSPADQLNYDTYLWELQESIARQKFREYLQPVSHQGGVQTLDGVSEALNFAGAKDYRDWLARMRAVPTVVDQTMALMREGVKAGNLPPRVLMDRVPGQIASQVVKARTLIVWGLPAIRMETAKGRRAGETFTGAGANDASASRKSGWTLFMDSSSKSALKTEGEGIICFARMCVKRRLRFFAMGCFAPLWLETDEKKPARGGL